MKDIKTIIFDWDGTLHESMHIYYQAFTKGYQHCVDKNIAKPKTWTQDIVKTFLGINPKDLWDQLLPEASFEDKMFVSKQIGSNMLELIEQHEAKLYPHTHEVLRYLKDKGYALIYLSNSNIYYMEAMKKAFDLTAYFDEFYVSEAFEYIPKKEILKLIKSTLKSPMVMIGDRFLDIETGLFNNIKTIGCLYGYGTKDELKDADVLIKSIEQLKSIF